MAVQGTKLLLFSDFILACCVAYDGNWLKVSTAICVHPFVCDATKSSHTDAHYKPTHGARTWFVHKVNDIVVRQGVVSYC